MGSSPATGKAFVKGPLPRTYPQSREHSMIESLIPLNTPTGTGLLIREYVTASMRSRGR